MNTSMTTVDNRTRVRKPTGQGCPACGGAMNEVERIQEYMFTYILYRCVSPDCRKECLEKWCVPIRDY